MNQDNKNIFSSISQNPAYRPEKIEANAVNQGLYLQETEEDIKRKKGSKVGFRVFCCLLAAAVLFASGIFIGTISANDSQKGNAAKPNEELSDFAGTELDITVNSKPDDSTADNSGKMTISEIFEFVSPSVVEINIYSNSADGAVSGSYSSGVVMSEDGYILSNDHIYTDITNPLIYVTVGSDTYKATFVAGDTRRDISILKIDAKGLTPAVFGKSSELIIGEDVYAIGNPAQLENSITNGIISSLDRRVTNSEGNSEIFIQTNAAISGGSSGGALVNEFGQVVGITSSKYVSTGVEGISFAIPIDDALEMAADLLKNGKVTTRAKMGIRYVEVNIADAEINDLPVGIMFYSADESSDLYRSGIEEGDVITEVNGVEITNSNIVLDIVSDALPGDTVKLKVWSARTGKYTEYTTRMLADEGSSSYIPPSAEDDRENEGERQPLFPEDEE